MKKFLAILMTLMCLMVAVGAAAENATESATKTLIVYFSASGTTAEVAQIIAEETQADLYELIPESPYTDEDLDWTDANSRVVNEHDNAELQNIALTNAVIENWEEYDTIYVGYPIWWRDAAWPIRQFITENDFTGKTVIPFCTSQASGVGESGANLAELAGEGDWQEGMRFSSYGSMDEVRSWLNSLK